MSAAMDKSGSRRRPLGFEAASVIAVFASLGAVVAWVAPCVQLLASSILPFAGFMVLEAVVLGGWGRVLFGSLGWTLGPNLAFLVHCSSDLVFYGLIPMMVR